MDPEKAHDFTLKLGQRVPGLSSLFCPNQKIKEAFNNNVFSLDFANKRIKSPFMLAPGIDKNAACLPFFFNLPIGSLEVGAVTPLSQPGNEKPRLFRLVNEESFINRLGFNNVGMDQVLKNIKKFHPKKSGQILGINLGKNKKTKNDLAYKDYQKLYLKFLNNVDFMVINISSPNTENLRDLFEVNSLKKLLTKINEVVVKNGPPLYLKITPDMSLDFVKSLIPLISEFSLKGIIATNTKKTDEGGLSGRKLYSDAKKIRDCLLDEKVNFELVGVGGFSTFSEIVDYWKKGGRTVQIYSALVYQGPEVLWDWHMQTLDLIKKHGCSDLEGLFSVLIE